MISIKPEIENIINNKFMKKIQPTSTIYDITPPSIYNSMNDSKTNNASKTNKVDTEIEPSMYMYLNENMYVYIYISEL